MYALLRTSANLMGEDSLSESCLLLFLKGQLGVQFAPCQDLGRSVLALMQGHDGRES